MSDALHVMVSLEGVVVEDEDRTRRAITWHRAGLDLGDAMIRAAAAEEQPIATFDQRFIAEAARQGVRGVRHVTDDST